MMEKREFPESMPATVGQKLQLDWGTLSGKGLDVGWHSHFILRGAPTHREMLKLAVEIRLNEISRMDISEEERGQLRRAADLDWHPPANLMNNAGRRVHVPFGTLLKHDGIIHVRCYETQRVSSERYDAYMPEAEHPTVTFVKRDGRPGFRSNGLFYPFIGFERQEHHRNVIRGALLEVLELPSRMKMAA